MVVPLFPPVLKGETDDVSAEDRGVAEYITGSGLTDVLDDLRSVGIQTLPFLVLR